MSREKFNMDDFEIMVDNATTICGCSNLPVLMYWLMFFGVMKGYGIISVEEFKNPLLMNYIIKSTKALKLPNEL